MSDQTLPLRFGIYMYVKAYEDGTLFANSGDYDEPNQHLISAGIKGKHLEMSV